LSPTNEGVLTSILLGAAGLLIYKMRIQKT